MVMGSPPPMRGKVLKKNGCERKIRITPAYAGKSGSGNFSARSGRDHPRLCGEKPASQNWEHSAQGSPPPMRGKAHIGLRNAVRYRITPAYAGKSQDAVVSLLHSQDHPRLCGEKSYIRSFVLLYSGSPPPMRGKAFLSALAVYYSGITPAYAGKRYRLCTPI